MDSQNMKYLIPKKTSSAGNSTMAILKTLREIIAGRNMLVTVPFSAPYFSASVARGHRHLLIIKVIPSIKMAINAKSKTQLNVFVMPLYRIKVRQPTIKKNIRLCTSFMKNILSNTLEIIKHKLR